VQLFFFDYRLIVCTIVTHISCIQTSHQSSQRFRRFNNQSFIIQFAVLIIELKRMRKCQETLLLRFRTCSKIDGKSEYQFQELLKVQIESEYRFPTLLFVQIILFYDERNSWKCKTNKILVSGAPFCSKQIEKWFQEFPKVLNK